MISQAPWEDKELSYVTKLGASMLVVVWLLFTFGVGCYSLFLLTPASAVRSPTPPASFIVAILIVVGGLFVFFKWLYPFTSRPTSFNPRDFVFPADAIGQSFEVRFMRTRGRTFTNKGDVRFGDRGFIINGTLPPPVGIQLLIILAVTILPLIIFRIGLGLIPALILAQYIGRESVNIQIPYQAMQLVPKGRTIIITAPSYQPANIKFRVATPDGERFYRELDPNKQRPTDSALPVLPPSSANPISG